VESPFAVVISSCEYGAEASKNMLNLIPHFEPLHKKTDLRHAPDMENEQRVSEAAAEHLEESKTVHHSDHF
jgi:hypothetical protein